MSGSASDNAPLKICLKTFKILLKSAVRMREMPFQRHKFQNIPGGTPKNDDDDDDNNNNNNNNNNNRTE